MFVLQLTSGLQTKTYADEKIVLGIQKLYQEQDIQEQTFQDLNEDKKALKSLIAQARQGHAEAQYKLAEFYLVQAQQQNIFFYLEDNNITHHTSDYLTEINLLFETDSWHELKYFKKVRQQLVNSKRTYIAKESQEILNIYNLLKNSPKGKRAQKNYKSAFHWYKKAATQGHHKAQHTLLFTYTYTNFQLTNIIAGLNNSYSISNTSNVMQKSSKTYRELIKYWRKKILKRGTAEDMLTVAQSLMIADFSLIKNLNHLSNPDYTEVQKDIDKAFVLFQKAAEKNSVEAQMVLVNNFYCSSHQGDVDQANYWYKQALKQDRSYAEEKLKDSCKKEMQLVELSEQGDILARFKLADFYVQLARKGPADKSIISISSEAQFKYEVKYVQKAIFLYENLGFIIRISDSNTSFAPNLSLHHNDSIIKNTDDAVTKSVYKFYSDADNITSKEVQLKKLMFNLNWLEQKHYDLSTYDAKDFSVLQRVVKQNLKKQGS